MNQGITPSIWTMITWGLGTYLTGNLLWASVISLVLVGFGFPLVWGILSGSMPRSGGEYIYNSRIIHPIVGIAESFGNAFVMIFWVYVLAPWIADPGLVILAEYQGWTWLYDPATGAFFGGLCVRVGRVRRRDHRQRAGRAHDDLRRQDLRHHPEGDHVRRPRRRRRRHRRHHDQQQDGVRRELGQARREVRLAQVRRGRAGRRPPPSARRCPRPRPSTARWASWSPAPGCSPTPTSACSWPARSSGRTRRSSAPTSSPSWCRRCS